MFGLDIFYNSVAKSKFFVAFVEKNIEYDQVKNGFEAHDVKLGLRSLATHLETTLRKITKITSFYRLCDFIRN